MNNIDTFIKEWTNREETLLLRTSGSTGTPKTITVQKHHMRASAQMTLDFLQLQPNMTALLCLSTDYIAGKMMIVRALIGNLQIIAVPPSSHPLKDVDTNIDFAAMIPMQVHNSMKIPKEREKLKNIRHLIIGGGAIDENTEKELKTFPNNIWGTYGMTETLSHIAMRRINGKNASTWYTPLNGITLSKTDDNCLIINAPHLLNTPIITNDIVILREDSKFQILGRRDNVICSAGIKIQIEEVERLLRPYLLHPFIITKRKDEIFGEIVAMLHQYPNEQELKALCSKYLPKYYCPRYYKHVSKLPQTITGKPDRYTAEKIISY